jgi:hypothetical protein
MIPQVNKSKDRAFGRVLPFAILEDEDGDAAAPEVGKNKNSYKRRKRPTAQAAEPTLETPVEVTAEALEPTVTEEAVIDEQAVDVPALPPLNGISARIQQALMEDAEATRSLADVREMLVGPISRLHEARMEEVLVILEESDRANRLASDSLEERCVELTETCRNLKAASVDSNDRIQQLSTMMAAELQKVVKAQDDKLAELFMLFDRKLEKIVGEVNSRIDGVEAKTTADDQALADSFTAQLDDLAATTFNNGERIVVHFENQLATAAARAELRGTKQIEALADGLSQAASRVLAMRDGLYG